MRRDRLISIGAVAVQGETISFADSFDIVLKQDAVSPTDNILVHGIGNAAQREGAPPAEALLRFLHYLGKSRLVAYHAAFDEAMIGRAMQTYLGLKFKRHALDLAYLAPALFPSKQRSLDDWLTHFGIPTFARHNALSDAYSTAQLFQVSLKQASLQRLQTCVQLNHLERAFYELSRMESSAS
ncbi:MAG: 3'-5' exonuclease [Burkholderiales bacterium]|nr:3'-5' exonuclease [Burkholderiales bacterium]